MWIVAIIGVVLLLAGAGLIWSGRRTQRKVNILKQAIPTSAGEIVQSFPGELVTVEGKSIPSRRLISEQGQTPCVYYSYSVVREYERTERQTVGSGSNQRTETRQVRSSETIASHSDWIPFEIEDESGRVRINPEGAEFDARQIVNRYEPYSGGGGTLSFGGFSINIGNDNRTLGHRFTESIIPADERVFVLGVVDEAGQVGKPPRGRENVSFVISHRNANSLKEDWESSARWQAYAALGSGALGILFILVGIVLSVA